jgi:hypothetical protein
MPDSMISRVGMRGLARLGRSQDCSARLAGSAALCASSPVAASPRPGTYDLMESSI